MFFYDWHISLSINSSKFIQLVAYVRISCLFKAVCIYLFLLIHLSIYKTIRKNLFFIISLWLDFFDCYPVQARPVALITFFYPIKKTLFIAKDLWFQKFSILKNARRYYFKEKLISLIAWPFSILPEQCENLFHSIF